MVMVNIDRALYEKISLLVKKTKVEHPTIKNFVEKAIRERVWGFELALECNTVGIEAEKFMKETERAFGLMAQGKAKPTKKKSSEQDEA